MKLLVIAILFSFMACGSVLKKYIYHLSLGKKQNWGIMTI